MPDPLNDGDPARIGPYRLTGRLGAGGMGQVFLGRSPGGRSVAVKVVRPELAQDPDFRRRFATEAAAARKVGGFYTAQVVDADTDANPPWLATAYVPGPSLHQAVVGHGPLPAGSVTVLAAGLAEGLAAVHAQGIVHRDLKPANVLLAEDGPRLIDFGIARALDATSRTQTSTVLGTAAFMSPEQAMGREVGPASDVFSLGCVLAFAATGHSPFGEGPGPAVAYRIVHEEPDLSGVPAPLTGLVGACLAKDPSARPGPDQVLAATAEGAGQGRWPPEAVTEVVTRHRTRALAPVDAPARGGTSAGPGQTPPPLSGRTEPFGSSTALESRPRDHGPQPLIGGGRTAIFWLLAVYTLICAVTALYLAGLAVGNWVTSLDIAVTGGVLMITRFVIGLGLAWCWLVWFRRARVVAERFAPGRVHYRPSMAVYGWFIPVGNLFIPKQIADDVWRASSPPGPRGAAAPAGLLHTWWALWLTTLLTWPLFWTPWMADGLYQHEPLLWGFVAVHVLVVPTAVVTALYVHRLSAMQEDGLGR
ncbi:protein kinase domain-containing protein [Nocardiopsis alborubida]|uniref:DUF4328 domain-containing protein n=1 Tax=Nocardiopsis alborubida TaxID=146802 RepID=A0A7X6MF80_9ACTN|nr:protein kinase [Nocardiopsis alborubida]NKZ00457.1 DUF4328 domain-containing protein [Nocardiopsis alborubida]